MHLKNGAGPGSAATDREARKSVGVGNVGTSSRNPQNSQAILRADLIGDTASTAQAKSWRATLPVHRAADVFPLMTADELKVLGEDIRKNGQCLPIVIWHERPGAG